LNIAQKAGERFAHLPRTWLDLAKVHQQRREMDAEISHLRHAFEMNPRWNLATLALTDALERRGELGESQKVFERALQHAPNDAQLQTAYAHLLWRQHQPVTAFEAAEHALRIAPGYQWPWDLLQAWSAELGDARRAVNFARELSLEHAGQPGVWLMLARILKEPGETDERIAAVDQALKLDLRSVEAWDLKAELLALAERFDAAVQTIMDGIQTCAAETHILHGRRAWIAAQHRRFDEAIRLMREVLTENASYVWGWHQLAHWLMEQNLVAEAAGALEQLRRLRPHDAWVSRQLGILQLKQDNTAAAKKSFAATLQIDPADTSAAYNLFDLQLKGADLDGAAQTLATMKLHQPGTTTQALEIIWLLRKNEAPTAREMLAALGASPDPDPWPLGAAAGAFQRAGRSAEALKIFRRFLKSGAGNPEIGRAAIGLLVAQKKIISATRLFLNLKPGERQRRAAPSLINAIAETKSKLALRWLLWQRREILHLDDEAWGKVGYALSHFDWMKQVVRWLDDWRHRKNVQPWMLFNLCLALRQLGRYAEADEAARYTLERWGHREGSADLRLFLAVEAALAGNVADAQEQLQNVSTRKNVAYDQDLLALAQALVKFLQVAEAGRHKQFSAVRLELAARFSAQRMLRVSKDVRRTFRRTGKMVAKNGGGMRAQFWFGWKLNWQWLLLPLLPVVLALAIQPPILLGLFIWYFVRRRK
jgi:tetratricopeptide (TPR) repeat protein